MTDLSKEKPFRLAASRLSRGRVLLDSYPFGDFTVITVHFDKLIHSTFEIKMQFGVSILSGRPFITNSPFS